MRIPQRILLHIAIGAGLVIAVATFVTYAIVSSVDNLDRYHDRLPVEKREHLLKTINKSVRRMSGMMEEVLVLGCLETDRMTFHPAPFEFRSFCQRICDEIESATSKALPNSLANEWRA